jgi:hypothetical protein
MSAFFELLADNASMAGRLVTTAAGFIVGSWWPWQPGGWSAAR